MPETATMLDPGFTTADADYPAFALLKGMLVVEFVDWQQRTIRVHFPNTAGVKWQELRSEGPNDRDDSVYEIVGSQWLAAYLKSEARAEGDDLQHYRLCFNACGALDVIASAIEMQPISQPGSGCSVVQLTINGAGTSPS